MKDDKSRILPLLMDPRQPDENNRAYAYRILRKNIMNIQLQPGCQLSEAELSEHLVMSRTPIHEALMMLKGEWLVDVLPQRGSIVSKISIQYINEGYAMRKMLEPALLRSLSGHLNQAQLSELHGLLEQQDGSACISHDVLGDYFITLDNEFHKRLYTYAGYDRIWQAMHNVTTHMDRVRYLDTALCQMDMETFREEHEQLYKYLMVGLPKDVDVDAFFEHHLGAYREHFQSLKALHWRQMIVLAEILLLFSVGFFPQELNLLANAIVSFSCAMQVQTFRKVNGYAYASTMCIGNMRSGMEALAVWIVKHDPKALRKVFHYLGIIFLFGVGAGLGWVAVEHFATRAIWWSCLLLVICFALMFIREDLEANPAIEQDLAEIRQEAGEIDHLLKEELHEEHEALRDTLEHKN